MSDVLREYLLALGWKINESSWNKFNAAVTRTGRNVAELGGEAVATGLAIGAMVERIARHYEELYYVSQRTQASVANLKAYGFAAKQVGLSAEGMTAAIESFAQQQRLNPGIAGLVKQFSGATDRAEQLVDVVDGLKKRFGERGYFAAARMASDLFGMDEPTFRMLWMNLDRLKQAQVQQKQIMRDAGIDADAAARQFTEFAREMNTFGERWSVLGQRIALDFLPYVSAAVRGLSDLLEAFTKFNSQDTEGRAGMIAAIATGGLGAYLGKRLLGRLFGGAAASAAGGGAAGAAGAAAGGGAGAGAATVAATSAGALVAATGLTAGVILGASTRTANKGEKDLYRFNPESGQYEPTDELRRQQGAERRGAGRPPGRAPESGPAIGDVTGMNADLVERLRKMRKDMPPELGGFEVHSGYRTPEEQAKLYANRARNPYPVAKDSQHTLGEAADLKFDTPEGARWVREQMRKYGINTPVPGDPIHFERAENRNAAARHPFLGTALAPADAGAGSVTLNQRTEIKVEQGPTALSTAQGVLDGQSRVNGDAVRNLGAKMR